LAERLPRARPPPNRPESAPSKTISGGEASLLGFFLGFVDLVGLVDLGVVRLTIVASGR
jgi:hypothetical protein